MAALIHRWPLTANANDVVGALHLTNNGGVTFGADGASFNGTNQWLSGTYQIPANATMSYWIKPTVWTKAMCLMYSFHSASTGVGMGASVAGVLVGEVTGQSISAGANSFTSVLFPSNQWTLVTFSAGSIAALYRGASSIGTAAITPTASGSSSFALGAYGGTNYSNLEFQGKMIDARIYDYALTAYEVSALVAAGPNPSDVLRSCQAIGGF